MTIWSNRSSSVQFKSVTQLCPTLFDPMDCSTPAFPVYHQLPEFTQTHVHWVSDAFQPSHPLLPPPPLALNPSQHQDVFKWVGSLHQVAKVLELEFSISPSNEFSGLISFRIDCLISLKSKGLSTVFFNTTVQKQPFFGAQLYGLNLTSIHDYWKNHSFD